MNISESETAMRKARKDRLITGFRSVVKKLNEIEEKLYVGGLRGKQHDDLLTEYRNLSVRLINIEYELTNDFGVNTEYL